MFRAVAVPPVIEMEFVIKRKLVEWYFFLHISHLLIDKEYTICYTMCLQNIKSKLICLFLVNSLCGQGT